MVRGRSDGLYVGRRFQGDASGAGFTQQGGYSSRGGGAQYARPRRSFGNSYGYYNGQYYNGAPSGAGSAFRGAYRFRRGFLAPASISRVYGGKRFTGFAYAPRFVGAQRRRSRGGRGLASMRGRGGFSREAVMNNTSNRGLASSGGVAGQQSRGKRGRGGRGRGRGSRGGGRGVTVDQLDAQLDAYMGDDVAKQRLDQQLDSYFDRTLDPKADVPAGLSDIAMDGSTAVPAASI